MVEITVFSSIFWRVQFENAQRVWILEMRGQIIGRVLLLAWLLEARKVLITVLRLTWSKGLLEYLGLREPFNPLGCSLE